MPESLVSIRVTEIGEFISHQSCERRFKLNMDDMALARSLPFFDRLFNLRDLVLQQSGRQKEKEWEEELKQAGVVNLTPSKSPTNKSSSSECRKDATEWVDFVSHLRNLDSKQRAYAHNVCVSADAAALWAVKEACNRKLLPSKKRIDVIKHAVSHVYEYPFAIYALRPGDPVDAVAVKFVDEGFPGLTLFPGRTLPDRSDALNSLVVVWICAKEKARRSKPILQPVRVMLHWKPMEKISDTGEAIVESYKLEKTTIDVADRDEVIHCIGGVDLRKWGLSLFSASS